LREDILKNIISFGLARRYFFKYISPRFFWKEKIFLKYYFGKIEKIFLKYLLAQIFCGEPWFHSLIVLMRRGFKISKHLEIFKISRINRFLCVNPWRRSIPGQNAILNLVVCLEVVWVLPFKNHYQLADYLNTFLKFFLFFIVERHCISFSIRTLKSPPDVFVYLV